MSTNASEWTVDPNEFLAVFRDDDQSKLMTVVGIEYQAVQVTTSRAALELKTIVEDLEREAVELEQLGAMKRGMNSEHEAMACRTEARKVRRELERFGR